MSENVIREGSLGLRKGGAVEQRYFVLYEDCLDYFKSRSDFQVENPEPRGRVNVPDIDEFEALDDGFNLHVAGRVVRVAGIDGEPVEPWADDIRRLIASAKDQGDAHSTGEGEASPSGAATSSKPAQTLAVVRTIYSRLSQMPNVNDLPNMPQRMSLASDAPTISVPGTPMAAGDAPALFMPGTAAAAGHPWQRGSLQSPRASLSSPRVPVVRGAAVQAAVRKFGSLLDLDHKAAPADSEGQRTYRAASRKAGGGEEKKGTGASRNVPEEEAPRISEGSREEGEDTEEEEEEHVGAKEEELEDTEEENGDRGKASETTTAPPTPPASQAGAPTGAAGQKSPKSKQSSDKAAALASTGTTQLDNESGREDSCDDQGSLRDLHSDVAEEQPLKLHIISASAVPGSDWCSSSDAYVTCEILNKPESRVKTVAVEDANPVWNFEVELPGYTTGDSLAFRLCDKDSLVDDALAEAVLETSALHSVGFEGELPLSGPGGKKGAVALLKIKISEVNSTAHARARTRGGALDEDDSDGAQEANSPVRARARTRGSALDQDDSDGTQEASSPARASARTRRGSALDQGDSDGAQEANSPERARACTRGSLLDQDDSDGTEEANSPARARARTRGSVLDQDDSDGAQEANSPERARASTRGSLLDEDDSDGTQALGDTATTLNLEASPRRQQIAAMARLSLPSGRSSQSCNWSQRSYGALPDSPTLGQAMRRRLQLEAERQRMESRLKYLIEQEDRVRDQQADEMRKAREEAQKKSAQRNEQKVLLHTCRRDRERRAEQGRVNVMKEQDAAERRRELAEKRKQRTALTGAAVRSDLQECKKIRKKDESAYLARVKERKEQMLRQKEAKKHVQFRKEKKQEVRNSVEKETHEHLSAVRRAERRVQKLEEMAIAAEQRIKAVQRTGEVGPVDDRDRGHAMLGLRPAAPAPGWKSSNREHQHPVQACYLTRPTVLSAQAGPRGR